MSEEEHKYVYTLDGVKYFVWATYRERMILEDRYGIVLTPVDED